MSTLAMSDMIAVLLISLLVYENLGLQ